MKCRVWKKISKWKFWLPHLRLPTKPFATSKMLMEFNITLRSKKALCKNGEQFEYKQALVDTLGEKALPELDRLAKDCMGDMNANCKKLYENFKCLILKLSEITHSLLSSKTEYQFCLYRNARQNLVLSFLPKM